MLHHLLAGQSVDLLLSGWRLEDVIVSEEVVLAEDFFLVNYGYFL